MPFYGISENGANIQLDQYGYSVNAYRLPSEGRMVLLFRDLSITPFWWI